MHADDWTRGHKSRTGTIPRVNVLGVEVSAIDMDDAYRAIAGWVAARDRRYVCITGVHGVMESVRDPMLRDIHNAAGLVTPDGMPLVWLCRTAGFPNANRVYGPDLMLSVCRRSVSVRFRHFLYGGGEGVAPLLATRLRARCPGLLIVGTHTPPFRLIGQHEENAVVEEINAAAPHIVWVGLSTPKQERWMSRLRSRLEAPVLIGVGAAFDFHAGLKKQAPRWMQRNGLEWLYRMMSEPRRLGPRYLRNNPSFLWNLVCHGLATRRLGTTATSTDTMEW